MRALRSKLERGGYFVAARCTKQDLIRAEWRGPAGIGRVCQISHAERYPCLIDVREPTWLNDVHEHISIGGRISEELDFVRVGRELVAKMTNRHAHFNRPHGREPI